MLAGQLATWNDLALWTMPSTSKVPGLSAFANELAQGICDSLNAVFSNGAQVGGVVVPTQLFDSRSAQSDREFNISLKSIDDDYILNVVVNTRDWNALVCEFFGGFCEHDDAVGEVSPIEQALRQEFAKSLVRRLSIALGAYGRAALALSSEDDPATPDDVLSIEVSILASPLQKLQCRMSLSARLVRGIWDSLCRGSGDLAHEFVACDRVSIELVAQMPFDRIPIERILDHANGDVMIVGDAARQKVRLLCKENLVCEGVLTELDGRYAIEITAVG